MYGIKSHSRNWLGCSAPHSVATLKIRTCLIGRYYQSTSIVAALSLSLSFSSLYQH